MARLPSKYDLSRPVSLRSGRAIAAADTSAIGRGVASLGQSIAQVGDDIVARQDLTDAARAEAHFLKRKLEIENGFERDGDYATFGTRGQSSLQQAMTEAAGLFRNAGTGRRWAEMQQPTLLAATDRIGDIGRGKQQTAERVATEDALKTLRDVYIDPLTSDEDRQRARANAEATINFGLENGLFDEVTAANFRDTYVTGADFDRAKLDPTVTAPSITGDAAAPASRAMQFFQQQGWSPAQAAGIVGNLLGESNLNPGALNPGDGTDGSDSVGIGQWNGDRAAALKQFAEAQGGDWRDLDVQLAFVQHELETSESAAAQALRAAGDIDAATAAFVGFERPQGWSVGNPRGAHNYAGRLAFAQQAAGQVPDYVQNLPADQRQVVMDMRAREAAAAATQQAAEQKLAYEQHKDSLGLGILTGRVVSEAEIINDPMLNDGDKATLVRSFRTEQEATGAAREFLASVGAGTAPTLNPYSSDDQALADKSYSVLVDAVPAADKPAATAQFVAETGMIPKAVVADVRHGLASSDPAAVATAMQQAAALSTAAPIALNAVTNGQELQEAAATYAEMVGERGLSIEEAAQQVIALRDPANRAKADVLKSIWDQAVKDDAFPVSDVTAGFDTSILPGAPSAGLTPFQEQALQSDYLMAAERALKGPANGDVGVARQMALAEMKRTYGVTSVSGSEVVTKYPPENFYPPISGSQSYIRDLALSDAKTILPGAVNVMLVPVPTGETSQDIRAGRPPRYNLMYQDEAGVWDTASDLFMIDTTSLQNLSALESEERAIQFEIERQYQDVLRGRSNAEFAGMMEALPIGGISAPKPEDVVPNYAAYKQQLDDIARQRRELLGQPEPVDPATADMEAERLWMERQAEMFGMLGGAP